MKVIFKKLFWCVYTVWSGDIAECGAVCTGRTVRSPQRYQWTTEYLKDRKWRGSVVFPYLSEKSKNFSILLLSSSLWIDFVTCYSVLDNCRNFFFLVVVNLISLVLGAEGSVSWGFVW